MSVRHNYDKQNLDYNLLRVEALEKEIDKTKKDLEIEKTRSRRFKKVGKGLYNQIEKLKIDNEKLRYEQT